MVGVGFKRDVGGAHLVVVARFRGWRESLDLAALVGRDRVSARMLTELVMITDESMRPGREAFE